METTEIGNLKELTQALEFLDWLQVYEPTIRIPGNISSRRLKKLVLEFCKERNYSNGRTLSEEINRWLIGKGPDQIINKIADHLKFNNQSRLSRRLFNLQNPFDRYGAVRFHALFLFRASDRLRNSIDREHWRDLDDLIGDDLGIYFTKNDLEEQTTGYKVINELKKLKLRVDILPALLLWEDHIEINIIIPLEGLNPDSMIKVVEEIVKAIKEGETIEAISQRGKSRSIELRKTLEGKISIKKGDNMNIYNYGNECIVGPQGNSKNSMFNVHNDGNPLEKMLTSDEIIVIKDLKNILMAKEIEEIEESKRIEGVLYLAKIAEAKNKEEQEENLAGWKNWLSSLGERGQKALSVLANTMTIAIPIATLLGIYPL